jgi:hypothetical protein
MNSRQPVGKRKAFHHAAATIRGLDRPRSTSPYLIRREGGGGWTPGRGGGYRQCVVVSKQSGIQKYTANNSWLLTHFILKLHKSTFI